MTLPLLAGLLQVYGETVDLMERSETPPAGLSGAMGGLADAVAAVLTFGPIEGELPGVMSNTLLEAVQVAKKKSRRSGREVA